MSKLIVIGISDQNIAFPPDTLVTYALGSCVGICLYDRAVRMVGLSHILLPESFSLGTDINLYKFADTAIIELIKSMERSGASRMRMTAKIAGGAKMFECVGRGIGERNVEAVKNELSRLNIRIIAEDTGGNYGRTITFDPNDGSLLVKTVGKGSKVI